MKQMKQSRTGRVLRIAALSVATAAALNTMAAYADNSPVDLNVHIAIVTPNQCTAVVTPAADNAYTLGYDIANNVGHFTAQDFTASDTRLTTIGISGGTACNLDKVDVTLRPMNLVAPPGTVSDGGTIYVPTGGGAYWLGAAGISYITASDKDDADQTASILYKNNYYTAGYTPRTSAIPLPGVENFAAVNVGSTAHSRSCGTANGNIGCFGYGSTNMAITAHVWGHSALTDVRITGLAETTQIYTNSAALPSSPIKTLKVGVAGYFGSNPVNAAGQSALEAVPNGTVITQQYQLDITLV